MAIPVYLFVGFLEAGKTTFVQETLEDPDFNTGEKTLMVLCDEGEQEYEAGRFAGGNVQFMTVEQESDLCVPLFKEYQRQHRIDRVLIEYNGMWNLQSLYDAMPKDWEIYQMICVADATTFESYLNNMRQLAVDKLKEPEVVLFNRCTEKTDKTYLHRAVRMVNRRAQIIFEYTDGSIQQDDTVDVLPWDETPGKIQLADEDFGIWYLDAMENPEKYDGREISMKAYVCQTPRVPKGTFVAGRFAMTCCADDISYIGVICEAANAQEYKHRSWVNIEAEIVPMEHEVYGGPGVALRAKSVTKAEPPQEELVYFLL